MIKSKEEYNGFWKKLGCLLSILVLVTFFTLMLYAIYVIFFDQQQWFVVAEE